MPRNPFRRPLRLAPSAAPILLTCLLLLAPIAAGAQTAGTLAGTVRDTEGGVLPGAQITARHLETGLTRATVTGGEGRFVLPALPVGAYELRAELSGFRPVVRRGIDLTVGQTAVLSLVMAVGPLDEEITISARVSMVNVRSPELGYLVGEDAIGQLPLNGRNYTDLALLQPGVSAFPHRDGGSVVAHGLAMSVSGADPRSNVYLLDGTLLNDFTNGPAGSAAGTTLGMETVREFRVEANAYSAEFGRNFGGQINVLTKSGTNELRGSAYQFHRNHRFDARNFFDGPRKPEFRRNQFGGAIGGPLQANRAFFFVGYEGLRERVGRTVSTLVPDDDARRGLLPDPANPGRTIAVGVHPLVRPYLEAFPRATGPSLGGGLAAHAFRFDEALAQHFVQGRVDRNLGPGHQLFGRYTFDEAEQWLPTDYPQFPRAFVSRNQFLTVEYRRSTSANTLHTVRGGVNRTRIGQDVEANVAAPLDPFVPGRPMPGNIDIGGLPRFGPQTSADVEIAQTVSSVQHDVAHTRGRHLLKAGGLVEHYDMDLVNPTFSLGIFAFASLRTFMENRPLRFVGLLPEGEFDRRWRSTLVGIYVQDEFQAHPRLTLSGGLRHEFTTMPKDRGGRDSALVDLMDPEPVVGRLHRGPSYANLSPRTGFAWDVFGDGRTALRGGYGLYFNTNNRQNLITTFSNPPATPRIVIPGPTFPLPPFERGIGNSIRPIQWDITAPRVHVWNVSVQREVVAHTLVTAGYAGTRGRHLLRSGDVNVPAPERLPDGTPFFRPGLARPNPAFSTIELKSSDGDSWYNALIVEVRRRWAGGFALQSSYTFSRSIDTTQASTFFSDATNGTTSAFPEFLADYNKGLSDFHSTHNWVVNFTWALPGPETRRGLAGALFGGWHLSGISRLRSGDPLTVFVQANRSRSLWSPSLGPGVGQDRPSLAAGRTPKDAVVSRPDQWFDPTAFVLQPAGTFGNTGRGAFVGPNLRTVDLALVRHAAWRRVGPAGRVEIRLEAFNVLNRANFGPPSLVAFAGQADDEAPLPAFGRIRSTVTSSRQIQLGVRLAF